MLRRFVGRATLTRVPHAAAATRSARWVRQNSKRRLPQHSMSRAGRGRVGEVHYNQGIVVAGGLERRDVESVDPTAEARPTDRRIDDVWKDALSPCGRCVSRQVVVSQNTQAVGSTLDSVGALQSTMPFRSRASCCPGRDGCGQSKDEHTGCCDAPHWHRGSGSSASGGLALGHAAGFLRFAQDNHLHPGQTATSMNDTGGAKRLSIVSMLVTTNDAFMGLESLELPDRRTRIRRAGALPAAWPVSNRTGR